jgi:hypothetical protein
MLFNRYVLSLFGASIVSFLSMYLILSRLDPLQDETLALPLFFISLFFASSCLLSLVGYLIRIAFYRDELLLNHFNVSLRQGIILGFCLCGMMGLQVMRTLTWWNGPILVIIALMIELYFVAKD